MSNPKIPQAAISAVTAVFASFGVNVTAAQIESLVKGEAPSIAAPTITQPLSVKETCSVLGISRTTFHEWRKQGRIRCAVPCRKKVLVDRQSVMALLDAPDKTLERHTAKNEEN